VKILEEKGIFNFLVLDEIQYLYLPCNVGVSIKGQIIEIGRIFCILTGSIYHLRQLCFGDLLENDLKIYPN
jgi:hypothetical protein